MKCKSCKKDINDGAKKCPECQSDLRNWFARHKIISFILILFILGTVLSAIGSEEKTNLTPTVNNKNSETEVAENKNVKKEYISVIDLKTSSDKNSDTFTLAGGKQKLVYKMTKKQFAMCGIYILNEGTDLMEDGGFPVVMAEESGETITRKSSGDYYLSVKSSNTNCDIELFEER